MSHSKLRSCPRLCFTDTILLREGSHGTTPELSGSIHSIPKNEQQPDHGSSPNSIHVVRDYNHLAGNGQPVYRCLSTAERELVIVNSWNYHFELSASLVPEFQHLQVQTYEDMKWWIQGTIGEEIEM